MRNIIGNRPNLAVNVSSLHLQLTRRALLQAILSVVTALLLWQTIAPVAQAQGLVPLGPYASEADRIGFNVIVDHGKSYSDYDTDSMKAGWFLDYQPSPFLGANSQSPEASETTMTTGMAHTPLLRVAEFDGETWPRYITNLVSRHPGQLWIIGNEPDRHGQDNVTPAVYAERYHDAYEVIKAADPTSQVAIAAVVEPTPLRRRYLTMVLNEYQRRYGEKMPVDVWTIHMFILPENAGWGSGIPKGLEAWAHEGMQYEVPDHGDVAILSGLIQDFRAWMATSGYQDCPLIITEYGILLAPWYDAGNGRVYDHEFNSDYMVKTFDFFRTAVNYQTGYPEDGYRLVQAWAWFGLNNYVFNDPEHLDGFNGNLADHDSGLTTPLGRVFSDYTSQYHIDYVDLAFRHINVSNMQIPVAKETKLAVDLSIYNRGNMVAKAPKLRIWLGYPDGEQRLLKQVAVGTALDKRGRDVYDVSVPVQLPSLDVGYYPLTVEIVGDGTTTDAIPQNNRWSALLQAGDLSDWQRTYLPATRR